MFRFAGSIPGLYTPVGRHVLGVSFHLADGVPEIPGFLAGPAHATAHGAVGRFYYPMVAAQGKWRFLFRDRSGLLIGQHFESSWAPSNLLFEIIGLGVRDRWAVQAADKVVKADREGRGAPGPARRGG